MWLHGSELELRHQGLALPFTGCVALSKSLTLPELQIHHL